MKASEDDLAWIDPGTDLVRAAGRADLTRLDEVQQAAGFACRVAAITCARAGADPPRLAEL